MPLEPHITPETILVHPDLGCRAPQCLPLPVPGPGVRTGQPGAHTTCVFPLTGSLTCCPPTAAYSTPSLGPGSPPQTPAWAMWEAAQRTVR